MVLHYEQIGFHYGQTFALGCCGVVRSVGAGVGAMSGRTGVVTKLGDVSFIPELQKAVAKESDPEVKKAMTAALTSLQSKQT